MQRIGIAASKMAKGNLWAYNLFVVLLAFLCSLLLFLIGGALILVVLLLVALVLRFVMPATFNSTLLSVFKISMGALAFSIGILYVLAIIKNLKLTKKRI